MVVLKRVFYGIEFDFVGRLQQNGKSNFFPTVRTKLLSYLVSPAVLRQLVPFFDECCCCASLVVTTEIIVVELPFDAMLLGCWNNY